MAVLGTFKYLFGTPVVWGHPGGSGVTNSLSLNNLASGSGQMGAVADLGANWDGEYLLEIWGETGTAPTAGNASEVYLAWSRDGTNWPGKVTGGDAAYPATVAANKVQLLLPYQIVATADANTVLKQNAYAVRAKARYVAPVWVHLWGQSLRNQATPANNGSRVILTPVLDTVQG